MKKVGIVTIYDLNNYGNRLQNYAVQEILSENGFDAISFKNRESTNGKSNHSLLIRSIISIFKLRDIHTFLINNKRGKRYRNFVKFNKTYIKSSKKYLTFYNAQKISENFDFFVVGSDQVWNPKFGRMKSVDLLAFFKGEGRIAFAPSLGGIDIIPNNVDSNFLKSELTKFKFLSTRETHGAKLLNNLLNTNRVVTLLDPTLLLDTNKWAKMAKNSPILIKNKYILLYFLKYNYQSTLFEIEQYAIKNGLIVINIMDKNSPYYSCGPDSFLHLIQNAEFIFTDSFHGTVFSILFGKTFQVFKRSQNDIMYSRIENLLSFLKLYNVEYNGTLNWKSSINFENVYQILKKEQKRELDILLSQFA